ncbi:MAG: cytochrome c [Acidobacteria bacterium]|nr:cytochrome c [Acidobacteriota bacterium]
MNRTHITATALALLAGAVLFAQPASRANETKLSAKNVTFSKDVAPIFLKNCAGCHRPGESAPMSLLSYKDARPWARSIREKVISREMPPWHADPHTGQFSNDRRLTGAEIDTIAAWVDGQSLEGDPRDLPPQPEFVEGWKIGKPDLILQMAEEFTLETTGPDEYHFFEIDPGFTEDKYVQMTETRPGNRRIVHHINVFVAPPPPGGNPQRKLTREESESLRIQQGKDSIFQREGLVIRLKPDVPVYDDGCGLQSGGGGDRPDGGGQRKFGALLGGFVPGTSVMSWEPGAVKRILAGSKIILNIHYSRTSGRVEKDRSTVRLIFARKPPQKEAHTRVVTNHYFQIPPGAENHKVTACWTAKDDIHLVSAAPHMHYRGKAMEIRAFYPDGRSEALLNVPRYDFSWQTMYYFKRPIAIPQGTRLMLTARYDNSGRNKYNPDPKQAVRWGDPTYDEMLMALFEYTIDNQSLESATANKPGSASQK